MGCAQKRDAHSWRRSDDRRSRQPGGWVECGTNRVQEIVSGTVARISTASFMETSIMERTAAVCSQLLNRKALKMVGAADAT